MSVARAPGLHERDDRRTRVEMAAAAVITLVASGANVRRVGDDRVFGVDGERRMEFAGASDGEMRGEEMEGGTRVTADTERRELGEVSGRDAVEENTTRRGASGEAAGEGAEDPGALRHTPTRIDDVLKLLVMLGPGASADRSLVVRDGVGCGERRGLTLVERSPGLSRAEFGLLTGPGRGLGVRTRWGRLPRSVDEGDGVRALQDVAAMVLRA